MQFLHLNVYMMVDIHSEIYTHTYPIKDLLAGDWPGSAMYGIDFVTHFQEFAQEELFCHLSLTGHAGSKAYAHK